MPPTDPLSNPSGLLFQFQFAQRKYCTAGPDANRALRNAAAGASQGPGSDTSAIANNKPGQAALPTPPDRAPVAGPASSSLLQASFTNQFTPYRSTRNIGARNFPQSPFAQSFDQSRAARRSRSPFGAFAAVASSPGSTDGHNRSHYLSIVSPYRVAVIAYRPSAGQIHTGAALAPANTRTSTPPTINAQVAHRQQQQQQPAHHVPAPPPARHRLDNHHHPLSVHRSSSDTTTNYQPTDTCTIAPDPRAPPPTRTAQQQPSAAAPAQHHNTHSTAPPTRTAPPPARHRRHHHHRHLHRTAPLHCTAPAHRHRTPAANSTDRPSPSSHHRHRTAPPAHRHHRHRRPSFAPSHRTALHRTRHHRHRRTHRTRTIANIHRHHPSPHRHPPSAPSSHHRTATIRRHHRPPPAPAAPAPAPSPGTITAIAPSHRHCRCTLHRICIAVALRRCQPPHRRQAPHQPAPLPPPHIYRTLTPHSTAPHHRPPPPPPTTTNTIAPPPVNTHTLHATRHQHTSSARSAAQRRYRTTPFAQRTLLALSYRPPLPTHHPIRHHPYIAANCHHLSSSSSPDRQSSSSSHRHLANSNSTGFASPPHGGAYAINNARDRHAPPASRRTAPPRRPPTALRPPAAPAHRSHNTPFPSRSRRPHAAQIAQQQQQIAHY